MKHHYLFKLCIATAFIILLQLFQSCNSDADKDGVPNKRDKCPNTTIGTKVDKYGCPLAKEIGNIHFYIETSASMGGYFKQNAEFKTIISDLTAKIENTIKPIDIWFIAETESKYSNTTQQFSSDFATIKIADQKSSELHNIINKIAEKNDSTDVALLVSDCILSFPDVAIKANPEINREEAPNALKNNIYSTFAHLKKKGIATSIYAFNSKFYGTYYDYQNGKKVLNGNKRPFYIWVIADKDILTKFTTSLNDIPTFKPEESLQFGLNEEPVNKFSIIPQIERKGQWTKSLIGINDIKLSESEPMQFCVGLSLDNLPGYAKEIAYLQHNLLVENTGCKVTFEVKDKSTVDKSKLKSAPQTALFENATHIIIFKVNEMALPAAQIQVSLPLHYDLWYMNWSCMDDRNLSLVEGKTFALEHLITGVKDAYETKNKNYLVFSVKLKK